MLIKAIHIRKDSVLGQLRSSLGLYRFFLFIRFINYLNIDKILGAPSIRLLCPAFQIQF